MEPADEPEPEPVDEPEPGGARRLHHTQSTPVVDGDFAGTRAELTAVDPDRADWLVSLLGAYESQKLVLDQYAEALGAVEQQMNAMDGIEGARRDKRELSRLLGSNSGVVHSGVVDDGHGMRARLHDGSLIISAADFSAATQSTLGRAGDASGNSMLSK